MHETLWKCLFRLTASFSDIADGHFSRKGHSFLGIIWKVIQLCQIKHVYCPRENLSYGIHTMILFAFTVSKDRNFTILKMEKQMLACKSTIVWGILHLFILHLNSPLQNTMSTCSHVIQVLLFEAFFDLFISSFKWLAPLASSYTVHV